MKAIIGLGNPGRRYSRTRHNFGFMVLDELVHKRNLRFKAGKGDYVAARDAAADCLFVKPLTYMNQSGTAVKHVVDYFNIDIHDLLIVYDDLDVELGRMKFRLLGSGGSHNGMRSVIYHLQSDDFPRLKLGIHISGRRENGDSVGFVLSPFSRKEKPVKDEMVQTAVDALTCYITSGIDETMNRFNR